MEGKWKNGILRGNLWPTKTDAPCTCCTLKIIHIAIAVNIKGTMVTTQHKLYPWSGEGQTLEWSWWLAAGGFGALLCVCRLYLPWNQSWTPAMMEMGWSAKGSDLTQATPLGQAWPKGPDICIGVSMGCRVLAALGMPWHSQAAQPSLWLSLQDVLPLGCSSTVPNSFTSGSQGFTDQLSKLTQQQNISQT